MNRVTIKPDYIKTDIDDMFDKLSKLEDIEEELGIDLITLFKAVFDGVYIKLNDEIIYLDKTLFYEISLSKFKKENHKLIYDSPLELHDKNIFGFDLWFQYYGKNWALTKEELENE